MTRVKAIIATAVSGAVVTLLLLVGGADPGATASIESLTAGSASFSVDISGDNPVILVAVSYQVATDREVSAITCGSGSLTRVAHGSLGDKMGAEVWAYVAPADGNPTLTITMTDDCDAEVVPIRLNDAHQVTPVECSGVGIGQDVASASISKCGGDASLLILFEDSSETFDAPSGFVLLRSDLGGTGARISVYLDDDASESSASLNFGGLVNFTAFLVGINVS